MCAKESYPTPMEQKIMNLDKDISQDHKKGTVAGNLVLTREEVHTAFPWKGGGSRELTKQISNLL